MVTIRYSCHAILFDLDGVLVDSRQCVERHWRRWASRHGLDAEAILRIAHGRRTEETIATVAPHLGAAAQAAQLTRAEERDTEGVHEIPGARRLLERLPVGTWAIATSGNRTTALTRLRHTKLLEPGVLVTADDVGRGKPAPDPYLAAARGLRQSPHKCLVIEDTPAGIAAAHAAGMPVIAVASTHRPEEIGEADAVVLRFDDIRVEARGSPYLVELDVLVAAV